MAGIVKSPIKCTPNDNPITKQISNNHLLPLGLFISVSHRKPK